MVRLLSVLALLCVTLTSNSIRAAHAQAIPTGTAHVLIRLKGSALAEDYALKVRSHATLGRFRLDPTLAPARWYSSALVRYQNQEIAYLRSRGIDLTPGYRMHVIFNGFQASLPRSQLALLRSSRNVVSVIPQRKLIPLLDQSVPLVNAPQAWTDLGGQAQAGKGMMIAQIDSGIDFTNPCFRDTGYAPPPIGRRSDTKANLALTNNKVIVARAFGSNANKTYSARDDEGHGTFGGAIEACDANTKTPLGTAISGVAPDAYLMNYNVFPADDDGSGNSDPLLPAMEAAVLDGADVINMSLGYPGGAGDQRLDVDETLGVTNAVRAGTAVVVSAGNAGPTIQTVSSPAAASDAIAVGATTNARAVYTSIHVGGPVPPPSNLATIESMEGSSGFSHDVGPVQAVAVGYGRMPGDDAKDTSANDFAGKDVHGKIAVIERGSPAGGTVTFETKINNAAKAGAVGVVIYNRDATQSAPFGFTMGTATLPSMSINLVNGKALVDWITQHPDATITLDPTIHPFPVSPDVISDYSARGYEANYAIKPDLVAPGTGIYSAAQSHNPKGEIYDPSGFTTADGTSFSAPHVTGAVALLLQKHPKWTPAMVKAALMGTANTNVYLDDAHTQAATIMDRGAGRLDVGAAMEAPAYVSPSSLSFGGVNVAHGDVLSTAKLTLSDLGSGSGSWSVSQRALHSGTGVTLSVPSSLTLSAGGQADVSVQLAVNSSATSGDYDGDLVFTHGNQSLHVAYFVHVANQSVLPGSVLLVDATTSRYITPSSVVPPAHVDVSRYYEDAVTAIGKTYTYWDEASQGVPSLADMKQASAVIYFTGNNLNMLYGSNPNGFVPPLGSADVTVMDDYLRGGGRLFVTGIGAAQSDAAWLAVVLGAEANSPSIFDTPENDPGTHGGISPPQPSARPDNGANAFSAVGPFSGLKPIDISAKGDGAKTNQGIAADIEGSPTLIGVAGLDPVEGTDQFYGTITGHPALMANLAKHTDVGVVSSDEPTFSRTPTNPGRSVLFSFGFEGINNNTGFATRAEVLQRIFQWFDDKPTARALAKTYRVGAKTVLAGTYRTGAGAHPAVYQWQVGSSKLLPTAKPTRYTFRRAGTYRVRVLMTDNIGHAAVSPWVRVTVR